MSTTNTNKLNIDEFGRDLSLKNRNSNSNNNPQCNFLARFANLSWAEIGYLIDEDDEKEEKKERQEELRKDLAERKRLYEKGLYELEEGEVIDM